MNILHNQVFFLSLAATTGKKESRITAGGGGESSRGSGGGEKLHGVEHASSFTDRNHPAGRRRRRPTTNQKHPLNESYWSYPFLYITLKKQKNIKITHKKQKQNIKQYFFNKIPKIIFLNF